MYREDSELIRGCLNGDETAWKELIQRYSRLVYSIPLRRGMSITDAEEVFQTVFTIVFEQLKTLRDERAFAGWLIRITQRECLHLQQRKFDYTEIPETLPDSAAPLSDEVEIEEYRHQVRMALNQLEPRCRGLLMALFIDSPPLNYQEIAARFGIPVGSIGPTRARCFKKLEAILTEMGLDFGGFE